MLAFEPIDNVLSTLATEKRFLIGAGAWWLATRGAFPCFELSGCLISFTNAVAPCCVTPCFFPLPCSQFSLFRSFAPQCLARAVKCLWLIWRRQEEKRREVEMRSEWVSEWVNRRNSRLKPSMVSLSREWQFWWFRREKRRGALCYTSCDSCVSLLLCFSQTDRCTEQPTSLSHRTRLHRDTQGVTWNNGRQHRYSSGLTKKGVWSRNQCQLQLQHRTFGLGLLWASSCFVTLVLWWWDQKSLLDTDHSKYSPHLSWGKLRMTRSNLDIFSWVLVIDSV